MKSSIKALYRMMYYNVFLYEVKSVLNRMIDDKYFDDECNINYSNHKIYYVYRFGYNETFH